MVIIQNGYDRYKNRNIWWNNNNDDGDGGSEQSMNAALSTVKGDDSLIIAVTSMHALMMI